MNEIKPVDPMNPFKNDTPLITICFEVNAYFRRRKARKLATFVTPVVGERVFVVKRLPDGTYIDTGIYCFTSVSEKDPLNGKRTVTAKLVNDDEFILSNERLKSQYMTLTYGSGLPETLTGTFTDKGYVWEENYVDLRQHVIQEMSKWGGKKRLKRDMECVKIRHPFISTYIDSRLSYQYPNDAKGQFLMRIDLAITVAILAPLIFGIESIYGILLPLYMLAHGTNILPIARPDLQRFDRYAEGVTRLYGAHSQMLSDNENTKNDFRYKARILAEIARGLPIDRNIVEWHIFKLNESIEKVPDTDYSFICQFFLLSDFIHSVAPVH